MKTFFLLILFLLMVFKTYGQYDRENEYFNHYGLTLSYINTGSGHGSGNALNIFIQKGKKCLDFGIIYQHRQGKIAGVDIKYRIFPGYFDEEYYRTSPFRPYFQYNLIYHKANVLSSEILETTGGIIILPPEEGVVATIEHYLGFGMQTKIYKNIYFENVLGAGIYLGSLDKLNPPKTFGIHKKNMGFTGSFKIALGYRIN